MTIQEKAQDIEDDFSFIEDWMEKYQLLIDLGKELEEMATDLKSDDNRIKGCQSQVWLHHSNSQADSIHFLADSDAIITKGIISLLLKVVNGSSAKDVMNFDFNFIEKIGLKEHLSPTRANGLTSMVKQIKFYALAISG
ncbi:MAG: cysteine desulfuration protein SufE [Sphingobacteriales bacterium]|jgi:cysteine desulfuration protein SufE